MTKLPPDLEALMPEPAGFRTRYRSEPGMIGHYPWTYADASRRRRKYDRPAFEYEDLHTADQVREAILAATERAAKICDGLVYALDNGGNRYRREADASKCAAAIRSGGEGGL